MKILITRTAYFFPDRWAWRIINGGVLSDGKALTQRGAIKRARRRYPMTIEIK